MSAIINAYFKFQMTNAFHLREYKVFKKLMRAPKNKENLQIESIFILRHQFNSLQA